MSNSYHTRGFPHMGDSCFANAVLQCLFNIPIFVDNLKYIKADPIKQPISRALQQLLLTCELNVPIAVDMKHLHDFAAQYLNSIKNIPLPPNLNPDQAFRLDPSGKVTAEFLPALDFLEQILGYLENENKNLSDLFYLDIQEKVGGNKLKSHSIKSGYYPGRDCGNVSRCLEKFFNEGGLSVNNLPEVLVVDLNIGDEKFEINNFVIIIDNSSNAGKYFLNSVCYEEKDHHVAQIFKNNRWLNYVDDKVTEISKLGDGMASDYRRKFAIYTREIH